MAGSFGELFELHGLPKKSGTEHVCNTKKFGELMSILAEVSTFRGEALLNRVLAAHSPGLPRGNGGIEFIASQPLAAAAVVELFSDIVFKQLACRWPLLQSQQPYAIFSQPNSSCRPPASEAQNHAHGAAHASVSTAGIALVFQIFDRQLRIRS